MAQRVTITTSGLASLGDGTYNVTATQVVSSVESNASAALSVTLDTTAPPVFTSTPPMTAAIGDLLTYNAQNVEEGATGSGLLAGQRADRRGDQRLHGPLTWTPTAAQLGVQPFAIVISDAAGNTRSQDLSVQVTSDALMAVRLDVTNASGTHLSSVDVGTDFLLKVFVQDLRAECRGRLRGVSGRALQPTAGGASTVAISFGADYPNSAVAGPVHAGI